MRERELSAPSDRVVHEPVACGFDSKDYFILPRTATPTAMCGRNCPAEVIDVVNTIIVMLYIILCVL